MQAAIAPVRILRSYSYHAEPLEEQRPLNDSLEEQIRVVSREMFRLIQRADHQHPESILSQMLTELVQESLDDSCTLYSSVCRSIYRLQ